MNYSIETIRADFPFLAEQNNLKKKPVYLDSAAVCQKPQVVIDSYASIHTSDAIESFEAVRHKVKSFINAASNKEIIFVRSATEAIHLVAQTYGKANLKMGDEIVITAMEHIANIAPWQMLCQQTGAILKIAPINLQGELIFSEFEKLLNPKTKLVAVTHVSNVLGTVNPVKAIVDVAHAKSIAVLVDGAQAVAHLKLDVQELDCDFYVFLGHKLYASTGVGVLYAKQALLNMPSIHQTVCDDEIINLTIANDFANKLEIGVSDLVDIVSLGSSIDYLNAVGIAEIMAHEAQLLSYAKEKAMQIEGLGIIGQATEKVAIMSFVLDAIQPCYLVATLEKLGISIRAGDHRAMAVMNFYNIPATARVSFAMYNTKEEIDVLMRSIYEISSSVAKFVNLSNN